ncbi:MAG TPA: hypothetical protein VHE34_16515 [Puia sp.]|uniref:HYC_CC_PP family protein n=1 Tax=Puia sp. TaxID=2045100 RepID=UPI0009278B7B|nr:hypothetical protein [Puia sp.]MBN8852711.1 hypothetical protein [Sphingobacteriales bacterium]OJW55533.1 MAG: hypothetical protein BGO55_03040 [Sphingobacteriales bacterium 50-39]HVU96835.1 hypothetical protein [Puia sp.]
MKKLISIFFIFIYLNTALGVGIDIHFCGGGFADVTIVGLGHAHCDCPPGSMPPGCCKNVVTFCKTDNHKIQAAETTISIQHWIEAPVFFPDYISPLLPLGFQGQPDPDPHQHRVKYASFADLYILHQVFRI